MSITRFLCSPFASNTVPKHQTPTAIFHISTIKGLLLSSLAPLAIAMTLSSPIATLALPSPTSQSSPFPSTTPYSQSQILQLGLEDGKIRPCPSTNPGCVSTNPRSSSFGFPWVIPQNSSETAVQKLRDAILKTQRNVKIEVDEETPSGNLVGYNEGHYLQAEVDGGFGRDVMEFLIKGDVVAYRSMATKVTYIYPFTTALGDSKGQKERMNRIMEDLGWYAPNFESMD